MRCSPTAEGWALDFLSVAGELASGAADDFRNYIVSAPSDWTLWDPTYIPPALQNTIQVVDNRAFAEVDVVKRVYVPLGLDRLSHATVLASTGPRFLGWVGIWREEPFRADELQHLSLTVRAIRSRLLAIDALGTADASWAIVEQMLASMERPAFLVRASGRIELANASGRTLLQRSRRSALAQLEKALMGDTRTWRVYQFKDVGVPDLALVIQRSTGARFEVLVEQTGRTWRLTRAQVAVLRLLARGLSNKEIAVSLRRAEGTIELHVSAILKRAQVDSRSRLLAKFWEHDEP
ncbi:MAG TPA: LuxR C-terminal-related transcriptional regulator [Polyangiaceae bacterium]|nr:LuxR C-terminal-related transcriptional regulator [Polyangiaceae bacterium]